MSLFSDAEIVPATVSVSSLPIAGAPKGMIHDINRHQSLTVVASKAILVIMPGAASWAKSQFLGIARYVDSRRNGSASAGVRSIVAFPTAPV
jgi:hypothetical protein